MTEKELIFEEWERCKNDFCYFYNKYTSVGKETPIPEELYVVINEEFNKKVSSNGSLERTTIFGKFVKIKRK